MFFINSSNTGRQICVPNFHGNQWAQLSWWAVDQTGRHPAASRQSVKSFPSPVYPTCPSHIWFPPHHYICLNKWWNGKWNKVKRNLFILKLTYTLLQMIKKNKVLWLTDGGRVNIIKNPSLSLAIMFTSLSTTTYVQLFDSSGFGIVVIVWCNSCVFLWS